MILYIISIHYYRCLPKLRWLPLRKSPEMWKGFIYCSVQSPLPIVLHTFADDQVDIRHISHQTICSEQTSLQNLRRDQITSAVRVWPAASHNPIAGRNSLDSREHMIGQIIWWEAEVYVDWCHQNHWSTEMRDCKFECLYLLNANVVIVLEHTSLQITGRLTYSYDKTKNFHGNFKDIR